MNEATATLAQLKKASKLTRLAFRKNGPKSYKRGQGALMNALLANDGATQRELVKILGWDRSALKDTVKALTVGGVAPSEQTVLDGSYVIQRPFVLVTKEGVSLSETAQKFCDFATSADAASIISAAGAVPVA